jgi:hypothetical protein
MTRNNRSGATVTEFVLPLESAKQFDLAGMAAALAAAGLPVESVSGSPDAGTVTVRTTRDLTGPEETTLHGTVASYDGRPRRKRTLLVILTAIKALSSPKQTAVWNDVLSGTPPKWQTMSSDQAVWVTAALATTTATQKQVAVAFFVRENVNYLVNPAFDPTINVPGDEPYTP